MLFLPALFGVERTLAASISYRNGWPGNFETEGAHTPGLCFLLPSMLQLQPEKFPTPCHADDQGWDESPMQTSYDCLLYYLFFHFLIGFHAFLFHLSIHILIITYLLSDDQRTERYELGDFHVITVILLYLTPLHSITSHYLTSLELEFRQEIR